MNRDGHAGTRARNRWVYDLTKEVSVVDAHSMNCDPGPALAKSALEIGNLATRIAKRKTLTRLSRPGPLETLSFLCPDRRDDKSSDRNVEQIR
jgi:hypothetical protein